MNRPLLPHERLAASLRASLDESRGDLTGMERGSLTWLRAELRQAQNLQRACGEVATREEWAAGVELITAELARRDAIKETATALRKAMAKPKPPRAQKRTA